MKTLVIVIHPDIKNSAVNRKWVETLKKFPEEYTVHQLYEAYPDHKLNIAAEQKLVEAHDKIVFQFPFYWFSCPPQFKQ